MKNYYVVFISYLQEPEEFDYYICCTFEQVKSVQSYFKDTAFVSYDYIEVLDSGKF